MPVIMACVRKVLTDGRGVLDLLQKEVHDFRVEASS